MTDTTVLTPENLRRILNEVAGIDSGPTDSFLDTEFGEMGCDSLSLIETSARIKHDLGVELPEDEVLELGTPRALLNRVNNAGAAEV